MQEEQRDIGPPLGQRRNPKCHDIQPVEEIGPEAASRHLAFQVHLACCEETHIERYDLVRSETRDRPLLQDPQKLRLQIERHGADFVEQDGPATAVFEFAVARTECTRKGTGLVPEQFALDQRLRERGTVDRKKRSLRPTTDIVQTARDDFLAAPVSPMISASASVAPIARTR